MIQLIDHCTIDDMVLRYGSWNKTLGIYKHKHARCSKGTLEPSNDCGFASIACGDHALFINLGELIIVYSKDTKLGNISARAIVVISNKLELVFLAWLQNKFLGHHTNASNLQGIFGIIRSSLANPINHDGI